MELWRVKTGPATAENPYLLIRLRVLPREPLQIEVTGKEAILKMDGEP